jgi:hypothetical protein
MAAGDACSKKLETGMYLTIFLKAKENQES